MSISTGEVTSGQTLSVSSNMLSQDGFEPKATKVRVK